MSLLQNVLDEIFQSNTQVLQDFKICHNFGIHIVLFFFFPWSRHSDGEKEHEMKNKAKWLRGFSYSKIMTNFEVDHFIKYKPLISEEWHQSYNNLNQSWGVHF